MPIRSGIKIEHKVRAGVPFSLCAYQNRNADCDFMYNTVYAKNRSYLSDCSSQYCISVYEYLTCKGGLY